MILTEREAKQLLDQAGIKVPQGELLSSHVLNQAQLEFPFPAMVKAQVLHGNRAQQGLVVQVNSEAELQNTLAELFAAQDQYGQPITEVLLEQAVTFSEQHYISLGYDTRTRSLVARYSKQGGVGMDDRGASIEVVELSVHHAPVEFAPNPQLLALVAQLREVFLQHDATLLEVNPLVYTQGDWLCLDAKIELEDVARSRHPEWENYPRRSSLGRAPTQLEERARAVSQSDHRGVAGESFFEFPDGNIGVLASGGGASTLAMDALLAEGLKPANYTEYSGNPTREKVRALTEVVLSLPRLRALYIVGSNANFTDIYETLAGVVDGFLDSQYAQESGFVVLIRRGGPRWEEAFEMVRDRFRHTSVLLRLYGPDFPLVDTAAELRLALEQVSAGRPPQHAFTQQSSQED